MRIERAQMNPLISPLHVTPSSEEMQVVSAFNAAAVTWGDETILMLRVAEMAKPTSEEEVAVPILVHENSRPHVAVRRFQKGTPGLDLSDPRAVIVNGEVLLSTLSHLRLARGKDGYHFDIEKRPAIFPTEPYEEYGIEDPRMTVIEGTAYINYTAVSRYGVCVALASTDDFVTYHKHGVILPPENKNVVIFPERVGEHYVMIHRPATSGLGNQQMWLAYSHDMENWGHHVPLMSKRPGMWDSIRIGAGAVPIKTEHGWLEIYHGVNEQQGYCLGAVLLDLHDPATILARSSIPFLIPETEYERTGFYGNVVFTCGAVVTTRESDPVVHIYYGAADTVSALCFCEAEPLVQFILEHAM
ncbi:MAG TPA: glycoside hydrolase family 130 protein [Armatimonadota bacterium]|nr:glycoside hydrolase family 130 protein [Armatimonadota bacterium]